MRAVTVFNIVAAWEHVGIDDVLRGSNDDSIAALGRRLDAYDTTWLCIIFPCFVELLGVYTSARRNLHRVIYCILFN